MVIKLKPPVTRQKIDEALLTFKRVKKKKKQTKTGLGAYFGIAKTGADGLKLQKKLRNDWD